MVRKRRRSLVLPILAALLTAAVAYVLLAAGIQSLTSRYAFADLWLPRSIDCLMVAWLFWVGSSIGSFLNVVAWRMPRGRSINGLSHCPWCNQRLSSRDNWPVFGWIALRGRCRTCRLPISPRYPIVELAVGLTLTVVGVLEIYGGLANLPHLAVLGRRDPLSMPLVTRWIVGVWVYHTVAVAGSWALGLVRFDGEKLPGRLVAFTLGTALVPLLIWWSLGVVSWRAGTDGGAPDWSLLDAAMRVLTALVAAVLLGRSLARYLCPTADPKLDPIGRGTQRLIDLIAMLSIPALVLGWQALLSVVILATGLAVFLFHSRWGGRRVGEEVVESAATARTAPPDRDGLAWFAICLPVAMTVQLALWSWTERAGWLPGSTAGSTAMLVAAAVVLILPAWLKKPRVTPDTVAAEDLRSASPD